MKDEDLKLVRNMLQELLLEQAMTKKDLQDFIQMSKHKMDKILSCFGCDFYIKPDQVARIFKLYRRLKVYERVIDRCVIFNEKNIEKEDEPDEF